MDLKDQKQLAPIWNNLLQQLKTETKFDQEKLNKELDDEQKNLVDLLVLRDIDTIRGTGEQLEEQFLEVLEETINELRILYIRAEMRKTTQKIREADSDEEKVKLKKEFQELSNRLS